MDLTFSPQAWEDDPYWQTTDLKTAARINGLPGDILRHPHRGIGKPEPLRHGFKGCWSRRIDQKHRLVYRPADDAVLIAQARFHCA